MSGGYAEMGARQNRKRGIVNIPGGKQASSPTKRRRLNILDTESSGADELAKIYELAGTECPAMMESDGTDCSGFRYYGALASTSLEVAGRFTLVSTIKGIDWQHKAIKQRSITRVPTLQPKTVSPTATKPERCESSKKFTTDTAPSTSESVRCDWGSEGKWTHLVTTFCADR
ncbi:hypothetical protein LTR49_024828 [Elasticomyces elasticus]|nr:hypothetical protein LTR49_024828 [Elasticomyces elasticus]